MWMCGWCCLSFRQGPCGGPGHLLVCKRGTQTWWPAREGSVTQKPQGAGGHGQKDLLPKSTNRSKVNRA